MTGQRGLLSSVCFRKERSDACRPDVSVITANPKTAGVARWNFLALWGNLMHKGDDAAHRFVADVSTPYALLKQFASNIKFPSQCIV